MPFSTAPADHPTLPASAINPFASQLIRRKARQLAARSGFSASDQDDIEQELRMLLVRRLDRFDPAVAHYNAFVTTLLNRYCATLIEQRQAQMRCPRSGHVSLSQPVVDGDGSKCELGATIPDQQRCVRSGCDFRSGQHRTELAADVELLIAGLAPELADICRRLQHESISGVARQLGISRSTLCDRLRQLRERFESSHMAEYL